MKAKTILPTILLTSIASFAVAKDTKQEATTSASADHPASKAVKSPYTKKNNSWITLTGKVTAADDRRFLLDYGKGAVTVEMDGWNWYETSHGVLKGDQVTVSGRVDRDKGEMTKIEASTAYVKGLNTFFYADASDEEDYAPSFLSIPTDPEVVEVQGIVTKLNGREFTVSHSTGETIIDTDEMSYDPTDDEGYQKIRLGDVVRVYGKIDKDLLEADEIKSSTIITIVKN